MARKHRVGRDQWAVRIYWTGAASHEVKIFRKPAGEVIATTAENPYEDNLTGHGTYTYSVRDRAGNCSNRVAVTIP